MRPDVLLCGEDRIALQGLRVLLQDWRPVLHPAGTATPDEALALAGPALRLVVGVASSPASLLRTVATVRALTRHYPGVPALLLLPDPQDIPLADIRCEAVGAPLADIRRTLFRLLSGCMNAGLRPGHQQSLTPRQREVLCLMSRGLNRHQIAARMGIDMRTVFTHQSAIRARLGLSRRSRGLLFSLMTLLNATTAGYALPDMIDDAPAREWGDTLHQHHRDIP